MVSKKYNKMFVLKRGGRKEEVHFDKITSRIQKLCYGLNMDFIDPPAVTLKVITGLYPGVSTVELDNLAADIAASMTKIHHDYGTLGARIAISNLHKETKKVFSDVITDLYNVKDKNGKRIPMISDYHFDIILKNSDRLNSAIIYDRDFAYNYFDFKNLEGCYLLKINGKVAERPQHMFMRVSVGIHREDIDAVIETYNMLSERYFTHESSTLCSAATPKPKLSSSFVLSMLGDSIEGIFDTIKHCSFLARNSGSLGLNIHCIRSKGSYIAGTNGISNGIVPMLRVYNNAALCLKNASFTIYLEPWHADIFEFLILKRQNGKPESRALDLFYALWIPDIFMKRVEENGDWCLMCPNKSPGLYDSCGEEFESLYTKYEKEGNFIKKVKAHKLWYAILESQMEIGSPYMVYKDTCNLKSNQKNIGTIKGGSFSSEIIQYSSNSEVGVCNLASIALNMFISPDKTYDFQKLKEVTKIVTRNLNKVIDLTDYPVPEAKTSNMRHRPIGIGVQGLADAFILLRYPFESEDAQKLNIQIFETIYYGAVEASCELAEKYGTYETYEGSPMSKGIFQNDMWNVKPSDLWNWSSLKEQVKKFGVRNSLLLAGIPSSSTANILGINESFEPYASNLFTRTVKSGEFKVVNHHLLKDLIERNLWNDKMNKKIIANGGSIQDIDGIPEDIKALYKTIWEISQKTIIKMSLDRGAFIDQSQSLNIHLLEPNFGKLTAMHFYGWKNGLKTGMHNLRTKSMVKLPKSTPNKSKLNEEVGTTKSSSSSSINDSENENMSSMTCSLDNREDCLMCGS